jgi:opacity protein-like surface antigen
MMEVLMMKKLSIGALLVALAVVMAGPAQAAFTVGGENGWSLSTDGIVNIFAAYQTSSPNPAGRDQSPLNNLLNSSSEENQRFGVRVGLLPSIFAINVKAPTTAGIDSTVRVSFWPNNQNTGDNRFNTAPNIDNREFFYTAKGKFGELLAGRALNLFQGQNILNDMCLFSAGVVDMSVVRGGTSLGHIGYGYLYTNFGPQFRYTTPDMAGFKAALEIAEPYAISRDSGKTNLPRFEAELSYATTFKGGSVHAWLEGMWQQDTRSNGAAFRPGGHNTSIGVAPGATVAVGPVTVNASGYYGGGLGMVSAQDGGLFGYNSTDQQGNMRTNWGFLAGATFQVTDSIKLGVNYGANHQDKTDAESLDGFMPVNWLGLGSGGVPKKCQEAFVVQANWNLNKFTVFTAEYIHAQDTWQDSMKTHSNQFALGTVFFW